MLSKLLNAITRKQPHTRIAFDRTGEGIPGLPRGIFTINPDGSDSVQIRASGESPKWSPDGRWIAFVEKTQDNGWLHSVFVMRADGKNERRLTFHHDVSATPGTWSPDSKSLAYSLWLWHEKRCQLCVVDLETANWRHLIYTENEIYTSWSPANKIVFTDTGSSRLIEVDANGQDKNYSPIFRPWDAEPVWTYDGSKVVCIGEEGMVVMNADGSERRAIRSPQGALQCAISPDGQSVVYSSSRERPQSGFEVFIVDLKDESKRNLVANPMKGDKEVDSRYVSWSPWL